MKTGQAAKALGVDAKTVLNWIDNPLFNKFFSDGAAGRDSRMRRVIDNDDLLILNTIRTERTKYANNQTDWKQILAILESDKRHRALPPSALTVETGITDFERIETAIMLKVERDTALNRVRELEVAIEAKEAEIKRITREKDAQLEAKTDEIMRLREEKAAALAIAEYELGLYREGRLTAPRATE